MSAPLLRQLLAVVKALLLASKRMAKDVCIRLLRKVALLWRLLCTSLRIGTTKKPYDPEKPGKSTTHNTHDPPQKPSDITNPTHERTLTTHTKEDEQVVPLGARISCSLLPGSPYASSNLSRASFQSGRRAIRAAHEVAVSSRNHSRSNYSLVPSPEAQSLQDVGYTIEVQSPVSATGAHRQYSLSSPQLGGSGSASRANSTGFGFAGSDDEDSLELAPSIMRRTPSSPLHATTALPAGETFDGYDSITQVQQLSNDRIYPLVPEFFQRYERTAFAKKEETNFIIPAFALDYKEKPDPEGWRPILHPEGVLYFYNEVKRAVTEANLYDERFLAQATQSISTIEEHVRCNKIRLPKNYVLAVDLNFAQQGTSILTDYYFADSDRKIIFFLDELDAAVNLPVWAEVKGVTSLNHIRHEMEAQYWMHGILYPSTVPVTTERVNELRDVILHYLGDFMNSAHSTSPFNLSDLNTMLGQVNALKKNVGPYQGAASLLSRMNIIFSRQKFYNWHGLPEVRINRDMSVHQKERRHKTWLIKILSPLLFSAPDVHLKAFERMWVDGIMHQAIWLESIKKLNEEWTEFILYATVLLNANVAFLAIQSVDIDKSERTRSPVQVACYLSIVSSIGSIILGLLLLRQNRTRAHGTTSDVLRFLQVRSHQTLGLETLAILYSLPYALLLWGMVSFIAGFAWNCFDASTTATRVIMGAAWGAFAILVMWCVWMGWVHYEHSDRGSAGDGGATNDDADTADAKSGTAEASPSEKHDSTRPGAESRLSRRSSRPQSRLSARPLAQGPVLSRPASRISQMSHMSGAPVHVPMAPVREATMEPEKVVDEEEGAIEAPSTGPTGIIRSLLSWPSRYPRLNIPGLSRKSDDSDRTMTDRQGNTANV